MSAGRLAGTSPMRAAGSVLKERSRSARLSSSFWRGASPGNRKEKDATISACSGSSSSGSRESAPALSQNAGWIETVHLGEVYAIVQFAAVPRAAFARVAAIQVREQDRRQAGRPVQVIQ